MAMMLAALPAHAGEIEIERMTWPEVAGAIKGGATTIIIPTGGTEQNGPHMVLGKHNFIVADTARRIARKLGNALVAPVISYVPRGRHWQKGRPHGVRGYDQRASGGISAVLESAAESFRPHGFKTVLFLGDSGPNQEPQRQLAAKLNAAWGSESIGCSTPVATTPPMAGPTG